MIGESIRLYEEFSAYCFRRVMKELGTEIAI